MFDLSRPQVGARGVAPYTVLYGQNGIGKTTLACMAPNTLVANIERGIPERLESVPRFPIESMAELLVLIEQLRTQQHQFAHLVVDSVSALNNKLIDEICREQKWLLADGRNDLGEKGYSAYGRGEKIVGEKFSQIANAILRLRDDRNVAVTLLGHVRTVNVKTPDTEPYSRYDLALPVGAIEVLCQRADIVGFMSYPLTVIKAEGQRSGPGKALGDSDARLYLRPAATHNAKNRFELPDHVTYPSGNPVAGFHNFAGRIPFWMPYLQQPVAPPQAAAPTIQ
jgi:hypothetical protein